MLCAAARITAFENHLLRALLTAVISGVAHSSFAAFILILMRVTYLLLARLTAVISGVARMAAMMSLRCLESRT